MNTFGDIIKDSFLRTFKGGVSANETVISLAFTVVLSLYLFIAYRFLKRKAFYNLSFNLALVGVPVITAAIVLAIQSNLVLSLGMVGALSIVRYRAAVKEALDLVFLFWGVAIGITCGAQQYVIAIGVSLVLTVLLDVLSHVPILRVPYVLVVNGKYEDMQNLKQCIQHWCSYYKVKSSYISEDGRLRMIVEIRPKNQEGLLKELHDIKGISVSLMTYEGDVVG